MFSYAWCESNADCPTGYYCSKHSVYVGNYCSKLPSWPVSSEVTDPEKKDSNFDEECAAAGFN